jgi:hypothetical protein
MTRLRGRKSGQWIGDNWHPAVATVAQNLWLGRHELWVGARSMAGL